MPSARDAAATPQPIDLRTARLALRPKSAGDAAAIFAMYSDPDVGYYMLRSAPQLEAIVGALASYEPAASWGERPQFAIVEDETFIGEVVLEIDNENRLGNLAYSLRRDRWGRGFATEAARAVLDYGFRAFDLAKIFAHGNAANLRSIGVMERLGMRREALLRSHRVRRGVRVDQVYYGIMRDEWEHPADAPRPPIIELERR